MKSNNEELKKSIKIGGICIFSYLSCYYLRNLLGVATPQMLEQENYTKEFIGVLSSLYFIMYAFGQLLNGILGDFLNPKKMVSIGLGISGLITMVFPFCEYKIGQILCFAILGFGLSMLRGPLMKTISENTLPKHARIICLFFSYVSVAGTFVASMLMTIFHWEWGFFIAGLVSFLIAIIFYVFFVSMEKEGQITVYIGKKKNIKGILEIFKIEYFLFYMGIVAITETAATVITFWMPTYLTEHLCFEMDVANILFSAISFIRSFRPFIALFIFKAMGEKEIIMIRMVFLVATVGLLALILIRNPWINITCLVLALMSIGCASTLLWSIYIPGLGKTGRVSTANGILDCFGYCITAIVNLIFANLIDNLSWNNVMWLWVIIALVGVMLSFSARQK